MQEILIRKGGLGLQIAYVQDEVLVALDGGAADNNADDKIGNIYLGQVERVVENLQAAFVDIGEERDGFLGAREARLLAAEPSRETQIDECVQEGDVVLVQLQRDAQGDKGAQITADISLAGQAMVLAPCRNRISISRSIEDEAVRARLVKCVEDSGIVVDGIDGAAGWVVRTAAERLDDAELLRDMAGLAEAWQALIAAAEDATPPTLLHSGAGILQRCLLDSARVETAHITIEDEQIFADAQKYCEQHLPNILPLLQAADAGEHLFDRYDIEGQLQAALQPRFNLPGGGWLMFETTEAMTTIDVNSGAHNAPPLEVNLEAAAHIARQIELRRLGGLIAIDFIDLEDEAARAQLQEFMEGAFSDAAHVRLGTLSEFCVLELTKRRAAQTLAELF